MGSWGSVWPDGPVDAQLGEGGMLLSDSCKRDLDTTRCDPPQPDMWRDWGEELRAADVPISAQFAAEQRLPLALAARDDGTGD